jgi:hypothetical protein
MLTTGSPTTEDIGQAEQFALSVVQGRPTQCRHVYLRSETHLGTRGTFTPKCERKRRGHLLFATHPLPLDSRIDSERYALAVPSVQDHPGCRIRPPRKPLPRT